MLIDEPAFIADNPLLDAPACVDAGAIIGPDAAFGLAAELAGRGVDAASRDFLKVMFTHDCRPAIFEEAVALNLQMRAISPRPCSSITCSTTGAT